MMDEAPALATELAITGPLKVHRMAECRDILLQAMQDAAGGAITLNLAQVDECDTAGVQWLLMCIKAPAAGITLSALSPAILAAAARASVPLALLSPIPESPSP